MRTIAGLLILLTGFSVPIAMLFRLNSVMSRKPAPGPKEVGLLLALNGVLPVSLVTLGMGLLSARMWDLPALRVATVASSAAAILLLLILWWTRSVARRKGDKDGR